MPLEDAAFHGMIPVSRRRPAVRPEEQSMEPEIIGMDDMLAVYEVTDLFGIDRESISVPLEKEAHGAVRLDGAEVEIVIPAGIPVRSWLPDLRARLEACGFEPQEADGNEWD